VGLARQILPGVDRYRVTEAMFEGLRVVLTYRGEAYSPAYVQGISGAAFVVAGPCPCAPTCGHDTAPAALARRFGYEVAELPLWGEGVNPETALAEVIERVKEEVRRGRPALVWNAFTKAEWDVVCGYDDSAGVLVGRGSYAGLEDYAGADQRRMLSGCDGYPALGAILVGERVGQFDGGLAEREALDRAVAYARTVQDRLPEVACDSGEVGDWRFRKGLGCYEWWIGSFRACPERVPNQGDRYCLMVYRSTHRAAGGFCRELAERHVEAAEPLAEAAREFDREADALDRCETLLAPGMYAVQPAEECRNGSAADLLTEARDAYKRAVEHLESALKRWA